MPQNPLRIYRSRIDSGEFQADEAQLEAVTVLDALWHQLVAETGRGFWQRLLGPDTQNSKGIYLWGSVGRGKTWMMDLFFDSLPIAEKQRIHFHRFMARVHDALRRHSSDSDPLKHVAKEWASRFRLLCFDEFHVSDIADAMLLSGLLKTLFDHGVVLVATSNLHPDELYEDGLQRSRFLPAIELIHSNSQVLNVYGATDYRLRILERSGTYLHPLNSTTETKLEQSFNRMAAGCELDTHLEINGRVVDARKRGDGIIWFDFDVLCEQARSNSDYIEISRSFNTVFLSGLPVLGEASADATRRFIGLVDQFYDRNVKLLISAASPVEEIYTGDRLKFEFRRTASRLIEMQSHHYLARPHLP